MRLREGLTKKLRQHKNSPLCSSRLSRLGKVASARSSIEMQVVSMLYFAIMRCRL